MGVNLVKECDTMLLTSKGAPTNVMGPNFTIFSA